MRRWIRPSVAAGCFLAEALPAMASGPLPSGAKLQALLAHMKANIARNEILAEQYTSVEEWKNLNWNKKGKETDDETAKYENVFVEGLPYRRKVAEDGKPLTGKAAAKEKQRYDKAVDERKHMTLAEKRGFFHRTVHSDLPMMYLTTLFNNRVTGETVVNGRKTYVVVSTPKADANPSGAGEKSALNWKQTTWIDEADDMPVRTVAVALRNEKMFRKGMLIQVDMERLPPRPDNPGGGAVWVQQDSIAKGWARVLLFDRRVETVTRYSDYKKFAVDVRLLPNTMRMVTN